MNKARSAAFKKVTDKFRKGNGANKATPSQLLLLEKLIETDLGFTEQSLERYVSTRPVLKGQKPTHFYIDIAHEKTKIAIEIDGWKHQMPKSQQYDKERERLLSTDKLGSWKILRFWNKEIETDIDAVVYKIRCAIEQNQ